MKNYNPMLLCDFYKTSHRTLYPKGTEYIYSTWTPRSNKHLSMVESDKVVAIGFQGFIKEYLINYFNDYFFSADINEITAEYKAIISSGIGVENPDVSHIESLHKLGYLPIEIKAVPEGSLMPIKCPMLTIENTHPEFFWVINYLETLMSAELWQPITTASIAYCLRELADDYAKKTGDERFVPFSMHDFSLRGMGGLYNGAKCGLGHLLSFTGSDNIAAIQYTQMYYNADANKEFIAGSVVASEHSVHSAWADGEGTELNTFKSLLEQNPTGILSLVSDLFDFWGNVTEVLPQLKDLIMSREGKLCLRPDSGCAVKILCGDSSATTKYERKGLVEVLFDIFGGVVNEKGYKVLDSHIGILYGDGITEDKAKRIFKLLEEKGFASTNIILGCGSFQYSYLTRDSLGFAMKATHAVINGEEKMLFKDPKTDDGTKRSQRGRVYVYEDEGKIKFKDGMVRGDEVAHGPNLLQTVFKNGELYNETSLAEIRERLHGES